LLLTSKNWFIKSYIGLYILSPILNCFCEKATEKQFVIFLTGFYIFQTLYGLLDAVTFINGGYSTFSFIGLYILAQYIKRYRLDSYKWRGGIYTLFNF
jgi:surface polysaccharide O-acyltransferase-like enzyme